MKVRKCLLALLTFLCTSLGVLSQASEVQAFTTCELRTTSSAGSDNIYTLRDEPVVVAISNFNEDGNLINASSGSYRIKVWVNGGGSANSSTSNFSVSNGVTDGINITQQVRELSSAIETRNFNVYVVTERPLQPDVVHCQVDLAAKSEGNYSCQTPSINVTRTGRVAHVAITMAGNQLNPGGDYVAYIKGTGAADVGNGWMIDLNSDGGAQTGGSSFSDMPYGNYTVVVGFKGCRLATNLDIRGCAETNHTFCDASFPFNAGTRIIEPEDRETTFPATNSGTPTELDPYKICEQLPDGSESQVKCVDCELQEGIWTAVGCIETKANSIVTQILQIAMGIAGGIALIMILAAGFMLSVSQGDPKRVSEARELITSAIIGLLFIVFSVTILQFIGVTLFQIPGLGG